MAKTIKAAAATVAPVTRDTAVGTLINEAGQAAASMLAKCKEAAAAAAKQLDAAKPIADRIDAVMSLYAADFTAAGHNVKALFKDALTLHAAGQTPVLVSVIGKDGKKQDEKCTALEAVNASKHNMRDAAKQVRDLNNMGRASGGGRKAKAPATAGLPAAPDMTVKTSDIDAFSAWLDNLPEYLNDAVYHGKIVARLIENGYTISKAAKGVKVTGKASA
ncbi:hypothetical protein UFOVP232_31 [uncultured Caudovirales phage]|uniref:Uncharacterized protein n=1 Tax=uncultured Caudovirales phage TaxID=2100421 RepID=A0A6J7WQ49_9CAUD|nr:hypothetical protein UFOVP232_31 [uncultured Caudovirales phage]